MRLLVIDDEAKEKIRRVIDYARDPAHYYLVGDRNKVAPGTTPGNNPLHVAHLSTYRCVFSYTQVPTGLYRHLSVSVPSKKYPNVIAAWTIAAEFGFTGWDGKSEKPPEDWLFDVNQDEHCVVVAQKMLP